MSLSLHKGFSNMTHWDQVNLEDLPKVATEIIQLIKYPVVCLKGEMGAGKTTLIKEILKQLKVKDTVTSPTFSIVNEYDTQKGIVYHFDFYRINDEEEAYDIGWEEYAYSGNLCFVEWAEKIENLIPQKSHNLEIQNQNELRFISFQ